MSNQELQREAERYAEYQREQEAHEQAQYDDELSRAEQRVAELEARIVREEARAIKAVKTWKEQAIRQREQRKAAEAALERVRGLRKIPWFDSHGNKIYDYVRADELAAALKEEGK